jgi:hypothetical protein
VGRADELRFSKKWERNTGERREEIKVRNG